MSGKPIESIASTLALAVANANADPEVQNSLSANPFKVLSAPPYNLTFDDFAAAYDASGAFPWPPLPPAPKRPPYGADVQETNLLRVLGAPPHNLTLNDLIAAYDERGAFPWPWLPPPPPPPPAGGLAEPPDKTK